MQKIELIVNSNSITHKILFYDFLKSFFIFLSHDTYQELERLDWLELERLEENNWIDGTEQDEKRKDTEGSGKFEDTEQVGKREDTEGDGKMEDTEQVGKREETEQGRKEDDTEQELERLDPKSMLAVSK